MHKKLKAVAGNPLIAGSIFIFSGGVIANIFNFVFNLLMSRNLTIPEYGTLVSIISIATLLAIPAQAVIPTIVTVSESFFEKKEDKNIRAFYFQILKPFIVLGLVLIAVFLVFSNPISEFLKFQYSYLVVAMAIIVFLSYVGVVNVGFLQARLSFKTISIANILSSMTKVFLGFGLVVLGFGINGAVWGYIFSFCIPIVVGVYILRKQLFRTVSSTARISFKSLLEFGIPSAIVVFCLNAFITIDIILVKFFFSSDTAGLYAGLSLVGRSIFYITSPIATVMFPLIVKKYNNNEKFSSLFFTALSIVVGSSILFTVFYYAFPDFTILFFLKKSEYLVVSKEVGHFGLFCSLYSVVFILSYFFLSIKQTNIWRILVAGVIVQTILITIFHDNFGQIINASIFVLFILILYLLFRALKILK